jgi:hypothetical protein
MDPITLAYYALICASLGAAAPHLRGIAFRLAFGAAVGIAAAASLPALRGLAGF